MLKYVIAILAIMAVPILFALWPKAATIVMVVALIVLVFVILYIVVLAKGMSR